MKNGKWKQWAIVGVVVLVLAAVAFIQVYEKPPAKDAWLDVPAICYEGRLFYWTRVFSRIPDEEGEWEKIGTTAGVSYKTELQEGYIHAVKPHNHKSLFDCDCANDNVIIEKGAVGEIWASPECPDVLYVYLREGYHSQPWVRFALREFDTQDIFCHDGSLYVIPDPNKHADAVFSTLPEGCVEAGKLLNVVADRVPTENDSARGRWDGEVILDSYYITFRYYGYRLWSNPAEPGDLYL